jgi:hypothetical protein
MQPDVGHDSLPTGFHLDATSAGTVHLKSALLLGDCWVSTTTVSPTGRAFPRTARVQLNGRREELGLVEGGDRNHYDHAISTAGSREGSKPCSASTETSG